MSPPSPAHYILAVVAALALVMPATAWGVPDHATDPFSELGGGSPSCQQDVGPTGRQNCAATGSIAHQHPIDHYGLDTHIDVGITNLGDAFLAALQSIGGLLWMALIYLLKGVLLLVEWGFSIDLLGTAMSGVRRTLNTLHHDVIGQPWFLAAISVAGLWGIWRGLVQRQATTAITGLLATVGLMVCALVILARPNDTVGHASRLANDASLGILAAATAQPLDRPTQSLSEAAQGVFGSLVRDPWCALQFGSVTYCDEPARTPDSSGTVADAWLAHEPGSKARGLLYAFLGGGEFFSDEKTADPGRVRLQQAGGTFSRLAILALVAVGLLGACALLAYIGIRLLLASVLALLLLLFAPAMLLAPAFGESGRATFVAWGKRLVGALAAKLVYALFLAVVLAGAGLLRRLDIGWFGTWLLQISFWWGVLLKRHELIGFVSIKPDGANQRGGMLSSVAHGYYAMQVGRSVRAATQRLTRTPRRAAGAVAQRTRAVRDNHTVAAAQDALTEFDSLGRTAIQGEQERATALVAERRQAQRELRVIDRRLTGFDELHAASRAQGRPTPLPNADQAALLRQRRALLDQLASPESRHAEQAALHAERNRAQVGEAITSRDLAGYRRRRAQDLASDLPPDHPTHLRAAGVDPATFQSAEPEQRAELLAQVNHHLDRERALLERIPPEPDPPEVRELRVDPAAARARASQRRDRFHRPLARDRQR